MKIFKLLVAIVSFGFVATEAYAQITKITASYVSDSAAVLPLWIAKDTGIFARKLDQSGYIDGLYKAKEK